MLKFTDVNNLMISNTNRTLVFEQHFFQNDK